MTNIPKILIVVAVLLIIIIGAISVQTPGSKNGRVLLKGAPVFSQDELLGKEDLTAAQKREVAQFKAELLAKVASAYAFTPDEKGLIGKLMLTEAHLYQFTNEEREAVFSALRR